MEPIKAIKCSNYGKDGGVKGLDGGGILGKGSAI